MDFSLTDEQKIMVDMLSTFSKNELLPNYNKADKEQKFPYEQWKKMAEIGMTGINIPEEYGGQDADSLTTGLVMEELSKGDFNCAGALLIEVLIADVLKRCANDTIKSEWLPAVADGSKVLALVITEPGCGTDAGAIQCKAVKKGDKYILNGEKSSASLIMAADATVVFAKTDPKAGAKGITGFLVPMDLPGITRRAYEDLGMRGVVRGSVFLDDVEIPEEYIIGSEGGAFKELMQTFDFSRMLLGLMCLGAARITIEETIQYAKERNAFGQPISKFEGVAFPIAEHYSINEAMRRLAYYSLWLRDQGLPHGKEGSMCKWMCPQYSVRAIHDCLILHGHYGYTNEFPIEQRLRDVIGIEIGDGTPQAAKIVISRGLFGRGFF